jgi:hypothetical protein
VERANSRREFRIRQIDPNGTVSAPLTVSGNTAVSAEAFPRIERSGNELFVTWTLAGDTPAVRTALVPLQ